MIKRKRKPGIGILTCALLIGALSTNVFAASGWGTNLEKWSGALEISDLTKATTTKTYYMKVDSVGGSYDSVEHWIEAPLGSNYSVHSITTEGNAKSPASTAVKGDKVTLNVANPINVSVQVQAAGSWSPN
jgi:hypothetical protein